MRSVIPMRIAKIVNILMSVCFCAFGIIIMAMPEISVSVVGIVIGIYLILSGVFKLIGYFSKDLFRLAFQYDLQLGMLLIALGTAILIHSDQTMTFICVIFGISILSEYAFSNCSALKNVEIPKSLERIEFGVFKGCSSLESITLPFVGAAMNDTINTHFGYIFGANDYSKNGNFFFFASK